MTARGPYYGRSLYKAPVYGFTWLERAAILLGMSSVAVLLLMALS
jgi:hypothetical protein